MIMNKRVLLTGAAGFVGSHVLEHILENTDWEVVCLVRLSTAGDLHRLSDSDAYNENKDRVTIVHHDLKSAIPAHIDERIGPIDYVLHLAANSHVDRSITHPREFVEDNVFGTLNLLEWARERNSKDVEDYWVSNTRKIEKFINFGTDEVFGPTPGNYDFTEEDRWRPSNPYSGSKAAQLALGISWQVTYNLPVITTYTMNIFGERQNPEKLVTRTIQRLRKGEPMTIHCKIEGEEQETTDSSKVSEIGQRHWLHARNAADALLFILEHGEVGEHYNVVGDTELDNKEMVELIAGIMGVEPSFLYQDFHRARPGHDRRYGLDGSKLKAMGWVPPVTFNDSMRKMVEWTLDHPEWLI